MNAEKPAPAIRLFRMRCGRLVHVPDEPGALAKAKRYGWREVVSAPAGVSK